MTEISPTPTPANLLSVTVLPSLAEVEERFVFFHYRRGSAFNRENLGWYFEQAVRNSCNKDLQAIIDARMLRCKSRNASDLYTTLDSCGK